MKRYKLLKKYPSLPSDWKEGMIVGMGDRNWGFSPESSKYDCHKIVDSREVKFHPEFWEEVKEKEYEVLSISDCESNKIKKVKDFDIETGGYLERNINDFYPEKDSSKYILKYFNIHSVRRLSDREVFSVGDKVEHKKGAKFIIKDIRIHEGNLQLTSGTGIVASISDIEHQKEPLFTTEDDVEIFEGDKCYIVGNNWNWIEQIAFTNEYGNNKTTYKQVWATKEAAEKWIDNNKPIYSKKQINEALDKCTTVRAMPRNEFEHNLGL